uniref:Vesicle-fusing ATPase n=1 Tax=Ditylenchus dipsaci TaxID=166011 RepID=A0A915EHE6_9BILA
MAQLRLRVTKMPTDELTYSNRAVVNARDLDANTIKHIQVITGPAHRFLFSIKNHADVKPGEIAFSMPQRKWTGLSLSGEVHVQPFAFSVNDRVITGISLETDYNTKSKASADPLDSDAMAREFSMQFGGVVFTKGQEIVFRFVSKKNDGTEKAVVLKLFVKHLEGAMVNTDVKEIEFGSLLANSAIVFDKAEGSLINLIGRSKGKSSQRSLINPEWNFQKMGIGGLDKEFTAIFRRAFASRVFPPEFVEQLAMKHVRDRQDVECAGAKNCQWPEILNKYVGESEANMRKLFAEAEEEWKRCASNSGLHIIIFDEIDAICKQRGSMAGSTGVHDTVVNQLLTKLDGVEQINNILVIGMTNRKDMIDEALLRPGRMEVQLEISLPDEVGRVQILKIHTARMREYNKMDPSVNLEELGKKTKNFSGAELEGLVRAAQSSAMNRLVKAEGSVKVDDDAVEKLMVNKDDFEYALEHDVKPAFGHSEEELDRLLSGGLVTWSSVVTEILEKGDLLIKETQSPDTRGFVRVLLAGPRNSGKTFLAAKIAKNSDFPFIKVCSPDDMVGFSETAKCMQLRKALLVLLGKRPPTNRRLLVIATTSNEHFLRDTDLTNSFSQTIAVPRLTTAEHIVTVLEDTAAFSAKEIHDIRKELDHTTYSFTIGIKRLLELVDFAKQSEGEYRVSLLLEAFRSMAMGIE